MKSKSAYHVRKPDGSIEGPFSSQDLRSRARAGLIDERDVVRREGDPVWVRAAKVGGIREILFANSLDRASESDAPIAPPPRPAEIPPPAPSASSIDAPSPDDTIALEWAPDATRGVSSDRGAIGDIALDDTPPAPARFELSSLEGSGLLSLDEEGPPPKPIVVPSSPAGTPPPAPALAPPPPPAPRANPQAPAAPPTPPAPRAAPPAPPALRAAPPASSPPPPPPRTSAIGLPPPPPPPRRPG